MSKECENCIKRKTMWCPTSIDCLALDELPYHLDKVSALEKIDNLQQENKKLKDGLHKILDLNKRAINCDSQKVTIKYLLKQYDLIYETLGELQPGLMKGEK